MTISDQPEFASQFGCLDTGALSDGNAAHAHSLRELTRGVNRLLQLRQPVVNVVFDASTDSSEQRGGANFGYVNAVRLGSVLFGAPLFFSKKANHRYIDLRIIAKFDQDFPYRMHVRTGDTPITQAPDSGAANVLEFVGSGSFQGYEIKDVPVSAGEVEQIEIAIQGTSTDVLGDTSTYGTPNTGSGDFHFNMRDGLLGVRGASWNTQNTGAATWADLGQHYVVIREYDTDNPLFEPRRIVQVYRLGHTHSEELHFEPMPSARGGIFVNDGTSPRFKWEIQKAGFYQVASVSAYSKLEAGA